MQKTRSISALRHKGHEGQNQDETSIPHATIAKGCKRAETSKKRNVKLEVPENFEIDDKEEQFSESSGGVSLATLAKGLHGVNQAIQTFVDFMVQKEKHGEQAGPSGSQLVQGFDVLLSRFLKLGPPIFTGIDLSEDPQQFLDDIWRRCEVLGCTDYRAVILASFRLEGDVAVSWYDSKKTEKAVGTPPWTWDEFSTMFMDRFLPESVKDARSYEFESLTQGNMTVSEYDIRFTQLSKYARHLIPTEERKMKRFVRGLNDSLFRVMAAHEFSSYSVMVDRARVLEARDLESIFSNEQNKRAKVEGQQVFQRGSGTSSFRGRGGHQWEQPKGFQQKSTLRGSESQSFSIGVQSQSQRTTRSAPHNPTKFADKSLCQFCGNWHGGITCHRQTGACFACGQPGHIAKNCPNGRVEQSISEGIEGGHGFEGHGQRGRGFGGRGLVQPGRGQARIFTLTQQDAQASKYID